MKVCLLREGVVTAYFLNSLVCNFFYTIIMADDNDNHLLALAALEVVRRHDDLRMIELNYHIHELTSELDWF